jgi:tetratricopeptide (TPR) repeat protein
MSRVLFTRGEEAEALKHVEKAVRLDENRTDYRRFYAAVLEQCGRFEDAYRQLRLARQLSPGDARILLRLADSVRRRGRTSQALEYLEMAAASDPENPLYLQELAGLYGELGEVQESEKARIRAGRLEQAFETYAEAVGLVSRGEEARAAFLLESVVRENPEFTTGAVLLGDIYRKTGKKEEALELYSQVLERDPSRARVKEETAWLYVDKGELETALELLKEAKPGNVNQALLEGYQKLVESDWEGAIERFKEAEMRYPLHPGILQQISLCLNSMGHPKEALVYLEKAHSVQPDNSRIDQAARAVRFEYGLDLEKKGRWREALGIFKELREEDREEAEYLFHEAYCRQNLWEYRPAITLYRKGLLIEDREAWVRINLATCLYALSLYDEAAEQWEVLVARANNPEYIYNLGLARIRQWRLDEGWKLVARAAGAGFEPARRLQKSRQR